MTFWWRRWMEHSRSPSVHTVPCVSASTCTSMWRAPVSSGSQNTAGSPNADSASRRADSSASARRRRLAYDAHAAAAAAGRRLDQHRELGDRLGVEVGQDGHARRPHQPLGLDLEAHRGDRRAAAGRPRSGPAPVTASANAGVLGQEAVPGMDRVGAGGARAAARIAFWSR